MAILARVASHGITAAMDLSVTVQFFDDNDPANSGVGGGAEPGVILLADAWTYPATLQGLELQTIVKADIKARLLLFIRARNASASAATVVPVGALVSVDS